MGSSASRNGLGWLALAIESEDMFRSSKFVGMVLVSAASLGLAQPSWEWRLPQPAVLHPRDHALVEVGEAECRRDYGEVWIVWRWKNAAGEAKAHTERFDVDYAPEALTRISDDRLTQGEDLLVGGTTRDKRTVIERWEIVPPSEPGHSQRSELRVARIYESEPEEHRGVSMLRPVNGVTCQAFLHFWTEPSLTQIDAETGAMRVAYEPPVVESEDRRSYDPRWSGRRSDGSYVYGFEVISEYRQDSLLLVDLDGDGRVDRSYEAEYAPAEWWENIVDRYTP